MALPIDKEDKRVTKEPLHSHRYAAIIIVLQEELEPLLRTKPLAKILVTC
jgi:hypothetical protein